MIDDIDSFSLYFMPLIFYFIAELMLGITPLFLMILMIFRRLFSYYLLLLLMLHYHEAFSYSRFDISHSSYIIYRLILALASISRFAYFPLIHFLIDIIFLRLITTIAISSFLTLH